MEQINSFSRLTGEVMIMKAFVPYEKLSKKKKREADLARRGGWGEINPVTRKPERSDAYNRRTMKKEALTARFDGGSGLPLFLSSFPIQNRV